MSIKAIFLDFYGTLVHEDDEIIPFICKEIQETAKVDCEVREIGKYWWGVFSHMFQNSYGDAFRPQRELGLQSLRETIAKFQASCVAEELIQKQFDHWQKPQIFADTIPFLNDIAGYQVYILSNIDSADAHAATQYHGIKVDDILTSEDVKAYKPRPELFLEALRRHQLSVNEVIHIGDSYLSDVVGAGNLGIKTVWLNRLNKIKPENTELEPTFICKDLREVRDVLTQMENGN